MAVKLTRSFVIPTIALVSQLVLPNAWADDIHLSGVINTTVFEVAPTDRVIVEDDLVVFSDGNITIDGPMIATKSGASISLVSPGVININATIRPGAGKDGDYLEDGQDGGGLTLNAPRVILGVNELSAGDGGDGGDGGSGGEGGWVIAMGAVYTNPWSAQMASVAAGQGGNGGHGVFDPMSAVATGDGGDGGDAGWVVIGTQQVPVSVGPCVGHGDDGLHGISITPVKGGYGGDGSAGTVFNHNGGRGGDGAAGTHAWAPDAGDGEDGSDCCGNQAGDGGRGGHAGIGRGGEGGDGGQGGDGWGPLGSGGDGGDAGWGGDGHGGRGGSGGDGGDGSPWGIGGQAGYSAAGYAGAGGKKGLGGQGQLENGDNGNDGQPGLGFFPPAALTGWNGSEC